MRNEKMANRPEPMRHPECTRSDAMKMDAAPHVPTLQDVLTDMLDQANRIAGMANAIRIKVFGEEPGPPSGGFHSSESVEGKIILIRNFLNECEAQQRITDKRLG